MKKTSTNNLSDNKEKNGYVIGQNKSHLVNTVHNQDKVLKESFELFKGGTLEFLDVEFGGEVTEILSIEITQTTTKKAYGDNALKLSTNIGINSEWEADISEDDMIRFASYNLDLYRKHKIPFTTVIITTKPPRVTGLEGPSLSFKPKIINLKERDADKVIAEIERKLKAGEHINELQLIYLPLYGSSSGKTTADLLDKAIKLTPEVVKNDKSKREKLQSLMILLNSTFISYEEFYRVLEENYMVLEENRAVRALTDLGIKWGIEQGIEQTAKNMLQRGRDIQVISEDTGLSVSRIAELQAELLAQSI